MYVCLFTCMCVCLHVCVSVYMYVSLFTCVCMFVCMCVCLHVCVCMYLSMCLCVCMYLRMCVCMLYLFYYFSVPYEILYLCICVYVIFILLFSCALRNIVFTYVCVCMYVFTYVCVCMLYLFYYFPVPCEIANGHTDPALLKVLLQETQTEKLELGNTLICCQDSRLYLWNTVLSGQFKRIMSSIDWGGARRSSVVRAFAHGHRIDPSWGGPIELFHVPASAAQLV